MRLYRHECCGHLHGFVWHTCYYCSLSFLYVDLDVHSLPRSWSDSRVFRRFCVVCWLHWYLLGNSHVFWIYSETWNLFQYNLAGCQWLFVYSSIPIMCDKHQIALIISWCFSCLFNATSEILLSDYFRILHCALRLCCRLGSCLSGQDGTSLLVSALARLSIFPQACCCVNLLGAWCSSRGSYRML